ncbi:helix-turn-helix domain-containing protein [Saccharothrix australiensis]|uniref:Helix-turn-helix protein n=1 Tax=Saccharothrix australiensis TaxID=2072 RepID=A0A495WCG3_9PSEU|nr:helix-turn-helix transcriptional regulator [Saccharothrix australiensis]RKT57498.1 helix-turn-helix protein [Saccharothrix australiensis]
MTPKQRRLARRLRQLRHNAGISIEDAATRLGCKQPKVTKMELAQLGVKPEEARALCELYGASEATTASIVSLARNAKVRGWYQSYDDAASPENIEFVDLETDAVSVSNFQIDLVPGLLQTREYARAVLRAAHPDLIDEVLEQRADLRIKRQDRVLDFSLAVWAIVTEAALIRAVAGPDVHRAQLKHLTGLATMPNVQFQIIPTREGEHMAMGVPFDCFRFDDGCGTVAIDHLTGTLFLEDETDVERYRLAFQHLCGVALSQQDSLAMLHRYAKEEHSEWQRRN